MLATNFSPFGQESEAVARMSLAENSQTITVALQETDAVNWTEVNYAWVSPAGDIVRVGTSKQPIGRRLAAYAKDINNRLVLGKGSTPDWEAKRWVSELSVFGHLVAFAHRPPEVDTVAGKIRPYLDIERVLIAKMKPRLNRSHR